MFEAQASVSVRLTGSPADGLIAAHAMAHEPPYVLVTLNIDDFCRLSGLRLLI